MQSLRVTHNPPAPGGIQRLIWKYRVRFEATFGLAMLEPWEVALIWCTLAFLTCLFYISVYTYLPSHLSFLRRRFAYYVYGSENADILGEVACSVREGLGLAAGAVSQVGEEGEGAAGTSWHMWDALRSKAGFGGGVAMRGEL